MGRNIIYMYTELEKGLITIYLYIYIYGVGLS